MTYGEAKEEFEKWAKAVMRDSPDIKFDFEWRLAYLDQPTNIAWHAWLDGYAFARKPDAGKVTI